MVRPLQRAFIDLADPRVVESTGVALYTILLKDDATRMGWIYPLKRKSAVDVDAATEEFLSDVGSGVKYSGRKTAPSS